MKGGDDFVTGICSLWSFSGVALLYCISLLGFIEAEIGYTDTDKY
jgi:hypothetical protein